MVPFAKFSDPYRERQTKCCCDVCDFLSFPLRHDIIWPISLLIISSCSSGLFTFELCLFENLSHDKLKKGSSKFLAYISNTIPAKSLWPPSEESPPPLPLFQCCYNDVDFSFDIFLNLQNNWAGGMGEKEAIQCYCLRL